MVNGPTSIPTGPKSETPPNTEKRIKIEGKFIRFPTMSGPKKLSISPTMITAHAKRPIASPVLPVVNRKIIAGTDTKAVPKVGMKDKMAAITPHRAPFGMPKIQNPIPSSIP